MMFQKLKLKKSKYLFFEKIRQKVAEENATPPNVTNLKKII